MSIISTAFSNPRSYLFNKCLLFIKKKKRIQHLLHSFYASQRGWRCVVRLLLWKVPGIVVIIINKSAGGVQ